MFAGKSQQVFLPQVLFLLGRPSGNELLQPSIRVAVRNQEKLHQIWGGFCLFIFKEVGFSSF